MRTTVSSWLAIRQAWLWLVCQRTCKKCGLFRVEAQIVGCNCGWPWQDANLNAHPSKRTMLRELHARASMRFLELANISNAHRRPEHAARLDEPRAGSSDID